MPLQHVTTTISNHHVWDSFLTSCRNGQTDAPNYHSQWDSNEAFNSFPPFFRSYNNPVRLTKQECKEAQNNPLRLSSRNSEQPSAAFFKRTRRKQVTLSWNQTWAPADQEKDDAKQNTLRPQKCDVSISWGYESKTKKRCVSEGKMGNRKAFRL